MYVNACTFMNTFTRNYLLLLTFYSFYIHACIRVKPDLDNSQPWDKTHKICFCGFFFMS